MAFKYKRFQIGAGSVNSGRPTGRTGTDNNCVVHTRYALREVWSKFCKQFLFWHGTDDFSYFLTARPDVFDLCYRRQETPLVVAARARGLRAADGLGMVVEQGALAFERWFGVRPNRDVMWAAVRR